MRLALALHVPLLLSALELLLDRPQSVRERRRWSRDLIKHNPR